MITPMTKIIKEFDVRVSTREQTWTELYMHALHIGFTPSQSIIEADRIVEQIFKSIGPLKEAELRQKEGSYRLKNKSLPNVLPEIN